MTAVETHLSYAERIDLLMRGSKSDGKRFPGVLFEDSELVGRQAPADAVLVEGVVRGFGFHRGRLEASRPEIEALLREIVDDKFRRSGGGGYSMLGLCFDRDGRQWGEHRHAEVLTCLAMGLGLAGYCLPKEHWSSFPSGMPYVWFEVPS
jgi:hypothetical protein